MNAVAEGNGLLRGRSAARLKNAADWLAVALVISLPWSTSASSILLVLWLLALLPVLDVAGLRRVITTPVAGLPVLLWLLAVVGMLWAEIDWEERVGGLSGFHKLLAIPLLLSQFRKSDKGEWALLGFLASCSVLLALSFVFAAWPSIAWGWMRYPGVPVKDYILQSVEFLICAVGAMYLSAELWRAERRALAIGLALLAFAFIANIFFVSLGRTALATMPVLFAAVGLRHFGLKGAFAGLIAVSVLAVGAWYSSPYLRERMVTLQQEVQLYGAKGLDTPAGKRLEWWKKSMRFIEDAPILGHGTGSVLSLFVEAKGETGLADEQVTSNPHNQILFVGVQLGIVGAAVLLAMWLAHFIFFFRRAGIVASIGAVVVVQNVVGSLFNAHLVDFTQGWMYAFGVGVCAGTVLRHAMPLPSATQGAGSGIAFPAAEPHRA